MKPSRYYRNKYIRILPSLFCPGCGGGMVLNAFVRAVDELSIPLNKYVLVSGIGCSAWIPSPYIKMDTLHTTHGRAVAFATGIKLANPELKVCVISGDGDLGSIGGNHLLHAARNNIDLTVIMVNNFLYGMTGGQAGPTTPHGTKTITTPYGNPYFPVDFTEIVKAAGGSFIAKWTTAHLLELKDSIKKGIMQKGFAFIEVISQCPTNYGRIKGINHIEMLEYFKKNAREGKLRVGVIKEGNEE